MPEDEYGEGRDTEAIEVELERMTEELAAFRAVAVAVVEYHDRLRDLGRSYPSGMIDAIARNARQVLAASRKSGRGL